MCTRALLFVTGSALVYSVCTKVLLFVTGRTKYVFVSIYCYVGVVVSHPSRAAWRFVLFKLARQQRACCRTIEAVPGPPAASNQVPKLWVSTFTVGGRGYVVLRKTVPRFPYSYFLLLAGATRVSAFESACFT